jgi:predicted ATPase
MLKRILIRGYKSLAEIDVGLQPLVILFGPNAAGESNFLDSLQLLSRMATSRTLAEAFEFPHRGKPLESFTFGPQGIEGLRRQEVVALSFQTAIELSRTAIERVERQVRELKGENRRGTNDRQPSRIRETSLRYRVVVEMLPSLGALRVADECVIALNARGEPARNRRPFLERAGQRFRLRREGQAEFTYHPRHLDHSVLSLPLYPRHHPHLVALREELASWVFFYFEPRERMRVPISLREVERIGPRAKSWRGTSRP